MRDSTRLLFLSCAAVGLACAVTACDRRQQHEAPVVIIAVDARIMEFLQEPANTSGFTPEDWGDILIVTQQASASLASITV